MKGFREGELLEVFDEEFVGEIAVFPDNLELAFSVGDLMTGEFVMFLAGSGPGAWGLLVLTRFGLVRISENKVRRVPRRKPNR